MYMPYLATAEASGAGTNGGSVWKDVHRVLWSAAPEGTMRLRGCQDRQHATATVECWFPSWFVSMNLRLHLTYLSRFGKEFQLSTTKRVADDSQSNTFAMRGNIEGLKHLFTQGLAGPRDVSDSRGYTLMR
jgi:hypothetical protein